MTVNSTGGESPAMSLELERRPYGPDSSPDDQELISSRVYMYRPDIICWNEVPIMSVWQVGQMGARFEELASRLDRFHLLINMSVAKPPNARVRVSLRRVFSRATGAGLDLCAVFTDKNYFINVAAKFVLGGAGLKTVSVHSARLDAEAALGIDG